MTTITAITLTRSNIRYDGKNEDDIPVYVIEKTSEEFECIIPTDLDESVPSTSVHDVVFVTL